MEKYWRLKIFCLKHKRGTFFSKVKNRCLDMKKWKTVIMRWKPRHWRYFQHIIIISEKNCVEKVFSWAFFYLYEKWRNLLMESEPKNMIFFKRLKSMFTCLKKVLELSDLKLSDAWNVLFWRLILNLVRMASNIVFVK